MALFMPTNITPDVRGELGNGTVDATSDLTISWQVNGNSAMTAFAATIYKNDAVSTQVYTTGKKTDGCPFYGTDYSGAVRFFSYTIPASVLAGAGITNGNQYKIVLTQYWNSTDSVVQASASVFNTRSDPTLSMAVPGTMATRSYTFSAAYSQAQGDALNWVRWRIAYASDTENPFYDTGNIYGTAQLQVSYDGFFKDTRYAVRCEVQTESGVEADTGWQSFLISYSTSPLGGVVDAKGLCGLHSAVEVSWPLISYTPGTADGTYTITDEKITLPAESSVGWEQVNNAPMLFDAPWSVFYRGELAGENVTLFRLLVGGGYISLVYTATARTLALSIDGKLVPAASVTQFAKISAVLTSLNLHLRIAEPTGGLYPGIGLYPGSSIFPLADTEEKISVYTVPLAYSQGTISGVFIEGEQVCDYVEVRKGTATEDDIFNVNSGEYQPIYGAGTYLLADFTNELQAGNLGATDDMLTGLSVYRRQGEAGLLRHVADLPLNTGKLYDFSARSQQGPYTYHLFPMGATTYITDPILSNRVTPCFWNWSILACRRRDGDVYHVTAEYVFGKNLSSGSISNNNNPSILETFTRYPTIQAAQANYKSGTLTSLIGIVDYQKKRNGYYDTLEMRDAVYGLSTTTDELFLKNRKGDLLRIRISGAIGMETMDASREQAQTATIPWVETGSADDVSIVATPEDAIWGVLATERGVMP